MSGPTGGTKAGGIKGALTWASGHWIVLAGAAAALVVVGAGLSLWRKGSSHHDAAGALLDAEASDPEDPLTRYGGLPLDSEDTKGVDYLEQRSV